MKKSHLLRLWIMPVLALTLFITPQVFSQAIDMEKLKSMKARSIGPAGMSGRVTAIDVVHAQPHIIYAGTASGGLWKSESGGIDWKPIFDKEAIASIGAVAIQQSNPDVVWAGTGEGNPRNSLNGGYGLYKSLDGGKNWQLMGLEKTRHIHRVILHRDNPDIAYVAAIGSPWGPHPERGVYKTTDGGQSWKKILYVNDTTGCADLVVDPQNPNKLIAAMWQHHRKPWDFKSGGPGSGLYVTYDGGETWEKRTDEDGLPKGNLGRIGLAIAPSAPNVVYALVESKKNALYRSDDGGFKWKMISNKKDIGNRPFYYSDIYVDPKNENRLYSLFTYVHVSEDGGRSFKPLMPSYGVTTGVHPDHHAWWIHPDNPNFMIDGNDGGLNITRDRGKSWRFVENLPIAQFYHINYDMDTPYNVYGGMQDNGSWAGPAYVWRSQGIRNSYWQEVLFGDGFDVVPDLNNSRYGFAMSQQGNVARYDRETGLAKMVKPTHPDPEMRLRYNWNAGIAQDPFDASTLYFGSQFIHKSTNKGNTWTVISPDLTTNDPEKQKQHLSGGLTFDATGAENYTTILSIAPSPLKKGMIWGGTDDGNIQLTQDGGKTWKNMAKGLPGLPAGSWIPQIQASTYNAAEAWVIANNYRRNDYTPYAYYTQDYGNTWKRIVGPNQVPGYTLAIVQDPKVPQLLFLGTEQGLYFSIDKGKVWTKWTAGFPTVPTMDLAIHPREHDLIIGTFGRAAYILDDIRPLRTLAQEGAKVLDQPIHVFEAPEAVMSIRQEPSGSRFGANALYNGENRKRGAMVSYIFNKPADKKATTAQATSTKASRKKKNKKNTASAATPSEIKEDSTVVKMDSVTMEVFNAKGLLIRTIKKKAPKENGLQRIYWGLHQKGVYGPRRKALKPNRPEPRGLMVLPGEYKIRISAGNHKDSTMVKVSFDPRFNVSAETFVARQAVLKQAEDYKRAAAESGEALRKALETIKSYEGKTKDKKGEEFEEFVKYNKAVKDSANALMTLLIGEDNSKKQGITSSLKPTGMGYLGQANWYIGTSTEAPGETEKRLLAHAKHFLAPAIEKINTFFETQWPEYQQKAEALPISDFKPYTPVKLD